MNEFTQFINQKKEKGAKPCGPATALLGYLLFYM